MSPRFSFISLWSHNEARAEELARTRENRRYLPGLRLPHNVHPTPDMARAVDDCRLVLSVVPSAHVRAVMSELRGVLVAGTQVVSATKGIESGTFFRMSQAIAEAVGDRLSEPVAVLSGPTFAREIAAGEPAAVVVACEKKHHAENVQRSFATRHLRLYTSTDVTGVELGAALKNVIAIGAGIARGLGLGSNSVAALITRGLAEITRLAVSMGGQPRTLSGLAGLGDLVLTATGDLSRNRSVGLQLGQGKKLEEILAGMTMVAEGVATCRAARDLGLAKGVDLPIIFKMYEVLYEGKDPREAIRELMERPLTSE